MQFVRAFLALVSFSPSFSTFIFVNLISIGRSLKTLSLLFELLAEVEDPALEALADLSTSMLESKVTIELETKTNQNEEKVSEIRSKD